jgi:uncharacterized protein YdaU (DUF1376 family)
MHYYTFNVGDYRRDTAHLSRVEHGIYRDLIDWYYLEEKPIPIETESVSRRLRLDSEADKVALKNVLADFFTLESDGYHHTRIDRDIDHYHSNAIKNRENGKKGGRPKTEKTQSVASGLPVASEIKAKQTLTKNQEPRTNNQEPVNTKPRERGPDFVLPDWIDQDHWDAWHSTPKRKKATPQQKQLAIKKLQAWRDQGLDYAGALENAATGGYQGLFLPNQTRANSNLNKQEALEARNKAVADQWLREQGAIV